MGRTETEIAWLRTQQICTNVRENTQKRKQKISLKRFHLLREIYLGSDEYMKGTAAENSGSS